MGGWICGWADKTEAWRGGAGGGYSNSIKRHENILNTIGGIGIPTYSDTDANISRNYFFWFRNTAAESAKVLCGIMD